MSKNVTITFEVSDNMSANDLHEMLCLSVYEGEGTGLSIMDELREKDMRIDNITDTTLPVKITNAHYTLDNRDPSTTWLHCPDGTIIEVNPIALILNVLENCATDNNINRPDDMSWLDDLKDMVNAY